MACIVLNIAYYAIQNKTGKVLPQKGYEKK
jgi:hypothetical protein